MRKSSRKGENPRAIFKRKVRLCLSLSLARELSTNARNGIAHDAPINNDETGKRAGRERGDFYLGGRRLLRIAAAHNIPCGWCVVL